MCGGYEKEGGQNGYFLCLRHTDSPKSCFKNIAQVANMHQAPFIIVLKILPFICCSTSFGCVLPSQQHTASTCACTYVGGGGFIVRVCVSTVGTSCALTSAPFTPSSISSSVMSRQGLRPLMK